MNFPETSPPAAARPPSVTRMPPADDPLEALDRRHTELLDQLDELDRRVESILSEYLPRESVDKRGTLQPSAVGSRR